jgi:hypothetical protein
MAAELLARQDHIRDVPGLNVDQETRYFYVFVIFLSPFILFLE